MNMSHFERQCPLLYRHIVVRLSFLALSLVNFRPVTSFLYGYSSENGVPVACLQVKVPLYAKREGLATEEPELLVSFQESTGHV